MGCTIIEAFRMTGFLIPPEKYFFMRFMHTVLLHARLCFPHRYYSLQPRRKNSSLHSIFNQPAESPPTSLPSLSASARVGMCSSGDTSSPTTSVIFPAQTELDGPPASITIVIKVSTPASSIRFFARSSNDSTRPNSFSAPYLISSITLSEQLCDTSPPDLDPYRHASVAFGSN